MRNQHGCYTSCMSRRTILLFDPLAQPQSWNERMLPGEYAVLYSFQSHGGFDPPEERKASRAAG